MIILDLYISQLQETSTAQSTKMTQIKYEYDCLGFDSEIVNVIYTVIPVCSHTRGKVLYHVITAYYQKSFFEQHQVIEVLLLLFSIFPVTMKNK